MMHAAALLLLLVQDKKAEELYRTFEKKVAEAKSVSTEFKLEIVEKKGEEQQKIKVSGTVRFKAGDKFIMDLLVTETGEEKVFVKSDGQNMIEGETKDVMPTVKGMSRMLSALVVRSGLSILQMLNKDSVPDPDEMIKVSDFKWAEGSRIEVKIVSYTLTLNGKKATTSLWIDTEKWVPVMRKTTFEDEGRSYVFEESYQKFSTDEIPDAEFQLGK